MLAALDAAASPGSAKPRSSSRPPGDGPATAPTTTPPLPPGRARAWARLRARGAEAAIIALAAILVSACGSGSGDPGVVAGDPVVVDPRAATTPSASGGTGPLLAASPRASVDIASVLCERIAQVEESLGRLRAVELRATAVVALDIELGRVDSAFSQLRQTELGAARETLEAPMRRLGYRVHDLQLAVEDFRTTSRPRDAAAHVQAESEVLADALAGFSLLAGC